MMMMLVGWIDYLQFYILFNSISVIPGPWADDNERLCAMESYLQLERYPPHTGLELGTTRSVGQCKTYCTGAPDDVGHRNIMFSLIVWLKF